jgi:chemotaxis protein CheD
MKSTVVGISDCQVCADSGGELVTYALGSCIAVSAWDPARRIGGLLHFMLPDSGLDKGRADQNPCMFADTGIPKLLDTLARQGADRRRLVIMLTGGAQVLDPQRIFDIGRRNHLAARKILWKLGAMVTAEEVGGGVSRTVRLHVDTERLCIREGGGTEKELSPRAGKEAANVVSRVGG